MRSTVAIAGASGFVGSALRRALAEDYDVVGLTRSPARASRSDAGDAIRWRHCDLFSLLDLERGLAGVDVAVYLVHSMLPSSRLTQGTFADLDLLLADNFARAAERCGVRQIVYLSGLLPDDTDDLSHHLRSRYEVERTLASRSTPVTTLRTGLVVGPGGSSLKILVNLVRRLPAMVLPTWTESDTQPIALQDVIRAIRLVLGAPDTFAGAFDVAGPDVMTYREMMEQTGEVLGLRRPMVGVPLLTPRLSTLWVSLFSSSASELAGPLVDSLRHDMVARDNPVHDVIVRDALTFRQALADALGADRKLTPSPRHAHRRDDDSAIREAQTVRSVQRLDLPAGRSAGWAGHEYLRWLDTKVGPLLQVRLEETDGEYRAQISLRPFPGPVLELTYAPDRSAPDRALFYVTGGQLADLSGDRRPRLEFREVLGGECLIAAIHDFRPRLPWHLYRLTQAVAHLVVMNRFGAHLERLSREVASPPHGGPDPLGSE